MRKRKYWTAEEKLQAILYVQSSGSVAQACRELEIDPSMYYKWKKGEYKALLTSVSSS